MAIQPVSFNVAPLNPASFREPDRPSPLDDIIGNAIGMMFQRKLAEFQSGLMAERDAAAYTRAHAGEVELTEIREAAQGGRNIAQMIGMGQIEETTADDPFALPPLPGAPEGVRYRRPETVARAQPFVDPSREVLPGTTRGQVLDAAGNVDEDLADRVTAGNYEADVAAANQIAIPAARNAALAALRAAKESGGFYSRSESQEILASGVRPMDMGSYELLRRQMLDIGRETESEVAQHRHTLFLNTQVQVKGANGGPATVRDLTFQELDLLAMDQAGVLPEAGRAQLQAMYENGNAQFIKRRTNSPDIYANVATRFSGAGVEGSEQSDFVAYMTPYLSKDGRSVTNQALAQVIREATGYTTINQDAIKQFARMPQSAPYRALYSLYGIGRQTRGLVQELDYAGQELPFGLDGVYEAGAVLYGPSFNDVPAGPPTGRNISPTDPATAAQQDSIMKEEQVNFDANRKYLEPQINRLSPAVAEVTERVLTGASAADIAESLRKSAATIRTNGTGANAAAAGALATWYESLANAAASDPLRFMIQRDSIFLPLLRNAQRK